MTINLARKKTSSTTFVRGYLLGNFLFKLAHLFFSNLSEQLYQLYIVTLLISQEEILEFIIERQVSSLQNHQL